MSKDLPCEENGMDTVEGWTNLLCSNEIYTCAISGGPSGYPSDKTEAFVFKLEVPGFGFG
jgi:hypothetical protein